MTATTDLKSTPSDDEVAAVDAIYNKALASCCSGRFSNARVEYQQALKGYEEALGPNHAPITETLVSMATLYERQMRESVSGNSTPSRIRLYKRTLPPHTTDLGQETKVVDTLNNLGCVYDVLGRYDESLACFKRVLEIKESKLGPDHHSVGDTVNDVGILYVKIYEHTYGRDCFERALLIFKASGQSTKNADTRFNLGLNITTLSHIRNTYEMEKGLWHFSVAVDIYKRELGDKDYAVADVFVTLERIFKAMGQTGRGIVFGHQGMAIYAQGDGYKHDLPPHQRLHGPIRIGPCSRTRAQVMRDGRL